MAMKNSKLMALVLVLALSMAVSVAADEAKAPSESAMKRGAWALQFAVGRDFTLGPAYGNSVALKRHTSAEWAWRLVLLADAEISDIDRVGGPQDSPGEDGDQEGYTLELRLQRLLYLSPAKRVSVFCGLGLGFEYSYADDNIRYVPEVMAYDEEPSENNRETTDEGWGVGTNGCVGFEWSVVPRISVMGEYSASLNYERSEVASRTWRVVDGNIENNMSRETTTKALRFTNAQVAMGLVVYF